MANGNRHQSRAALRAGAAALVLSSAGLSAQLHAQEIPEEELFDLGTLGGQLSGAFQTDADGSTVLGYAQTEDNTVRLVIWRNGAITDITPEGARLALNALDRNGTRNFLMSRDGTTVTGYFYDNANVAVVIRDGTVTRLTGADFLFPRAISHDGLVIAGNGGTFGEGQRAFYYDAGGLHWLLQLDRPPAGFVSNSALANAINADGSVIVGSDVNGPERAVRWENGIIQDLGVLPNGVTSRANDVSADGTVVVGYSNVEYSTQFILPEAFIWRDGTMTGLGFLNNTDEPGNNQSVANAVSGDGSTVIGASRWRNSDGVTLSQGFVWRDGVMQNIGEIPTTFQGGSFATTSAVSFDGHAIAGQARSMDYAMEAFIWRDGEITMLGTLGGTQSYATDVSDDGSTVVGVSTNASGYSRAFIWRTVMQDFTNILGSFAGLAEEAELAIGLSSERLRRIERPGCTVAKRKFCIGIAASAWQAGPSSLSARPDEFSLSLSGAVRPHRLITLGLTHAWSDSNSGSNRIDMHGSRAWSAWGRIGKEESTAGPSLEAWYGESRDRLAIDRTAGLADVESASGRASLHGRNFGIRLSYRLPLSQSWSIEPSAGLAQSKVRRTSFLETAVDFPADYASSGIEMKRAGMGLDLSGKAGPGWVRASLAGEKIFDRARSVIAGQSAIPGAEEFALASALEPNETRGRVELGYVLPIGPARLSLSVNAATPEYGSRQDWGGKTSLRVEF
ncbi:MAG: autotransporter domain-containing protein [Sphingomonadaceae bacterium]